LEAIAELHNDLTLFLDELAQMDPREAAEVAYLLGNGSGKARMSRNVGARKKLSWALVFVSAGEVTLADHAQTAGKRTKGGAEVRLLNIEADAGAGLGLFENLHGASSLDLFARRLKEAAARYYGAPLRAHLEFITGKRAEVESTLRNFQMDFLKNRVPAGAAGEVCRAAQRFCGNRGGRRVGDRCRDNWLGAR
jgi:putative DNA primase/helicase